MQLDNQVIISAAGSRKTSAIVESSITCDKEYILILTYTIENHKTIQRYLIQKLGSIPINIHVQTWFTFLLHDCIRPYQNYLYDKQRIENIFFVEGRSVPFVPKTNLEKYFLFNGNLIYTDKISEFALLCNERSDGKVISRLESIYSRIYVDEAQDLAGYDFDWLEALLRSRMKIMLVGDPRQATYFTNCSPKNSRFRGSNISALFEAWQKLGLCKVVKNNTCYRSTQDICDFADSLYPDMPKTISVNKVYIQKSIDPLLRIN